MYKINVTHLKLTQCYVSIISKIFIQLWWAKKTKILATTVAANP